ncbi:MAG: ribbon-helix-helix protein, CopG family [Betaproteobacteria bacterium]|nr:ribbon-helix-helix protein, CopG family [Betaproteobacteria bacterium]
MTDADRDLVLDPALYPKQIALELPPHVAEYVAKKSALTGRSEAEIILEILDRELGA